MILLGARRARRVGIYTHKGEDLKKNIYIFDRTDGGTTGNTDLGNNKDKSQ